MEYRKVVQSTGGVLFLSIPAKYWKENGVKKGDTMEADWSGDVLTFRPIPKNTEAKDFEGF